MCQGLCQEKCKVCYDLGHSCCHTQPIMTENELAKIYYLAGDLIDQKCTVSRLDGNQFVLAPNSVIHDGGININEEMCLFYDKEKKECKIYDIRPKICREYGQVNDLPCPFNGVSIDEMQKMSQEERDKLVEIADRSTKMQLKSLATRYTSFIPKPLYKIQPLNRKSLKNLPEYMILVVVMYYLNYIITEQQDVMKDKLVMNFNYKLGLTGENKINAIRIDKVKSHDVNYTVIAELHNFLHPKILSENPDLVELATDKINKLIKGLKTKKCKHPNPEKEWQLYLLFAVLMYRKYIMDYKMKQKKFIGKIKTQELFKFIKFITEETGGYDSDNKFEFNEIIRCVIYNVEIHYKAIIQTKGK